MNDEVNQAVDCIMDCPSSELLNFQSNICKSLLQENVDPEVCMNKCLTLPEFFDQV